MFERRSLYPLSFGNDIQLKTRDAQSHDLSFIIALGDRYPASFFIFSVGSRECYSDFVTMEFAKVLYLDKSDRSFTVPVGYIRYDKNTVMDPLYFEDEEDFEQKHYYYVKYRDCPESCVVDHIHQAYYPSLILKLASKYSKRPFSCQDAIENISSKNLRNSKMVNERVRS